MESAIIGVDPGKKGAAVVLSTSRIILEIYEYVDPLETARNIFRWKEDYNIVLAILERVHSFPGQGVVSSFSFGMNYGVWQGVLSSATVHWKLVTPQAWQ